MQRIYSGARDTLIRLNDDKVREIENNSFGCICESLEAPPGRGTGTLRRIWVWGGGHLPTLLSSLSNLQYWAAQEVVYTQQATLVTSFGLVPFRVLEDLLGTEMTQGDLATRDFESLRPA